MDERQLLQRFGMCPVESDLAEIRSILLELTRRERAGGDVAPEMRVCCVQLFHAGHVEDALAIWQAKQASMDAGAGIDIQLLCGAGLEETKRYLASVQSEAAPEALAYLTECETAGDFLAWSPADFKTFWRSYYDKP